MGILVQRLNQFSRTTHHVDDRVVSIAMTSGLRAPFVSAAVTVPQNQRCAVWPAQMPSRVPGLNKKPGSSEIMLDPGFNQTNQFRESLRDSLGNPLNYLIQARTTRRRAIPRTPIPRADKARLRVPGSGTDETAVAVTCI